MNFNSRLCNPTGEEVKINWHAGINIRIRPDDFIDLNYRQMEDFQDGKPGSEEMKETMNHYGIFIRDPDRVYENQALEALNLAYRSRKAQFDAAAADLRKRRAAEGLPTDPEAFEATLDHMGYGSYRKRMNAIFARIKFLERHVASEKVKIRQEIDPERTLIFLNPPKVFVTKMALQMFLADEGNEEIKEKYESWLAAQKQAEEEANAGAGEV
jgi:hypothetical protein